MGYWGRDKMGISDEDMGGSGRESGGLKEERRSHHLTLAATEIFLGVLVKLARVCGRENRTASKKNYPFFF